MKYIQRLIDKKIQTKLQIAGTILIVGVRACGKTTSSRQFSNSEIKIDKSPKWNKILETTPEVILEGETPRLIDEWQLLPRLWNMVRDKIDKENSKGLYILSGSSAPNLSYGMHTGAMRISKIILRTMSLQESGDSSDEVNFKDLFTGDKKISGLSFFNRDKAIDLMIKGGWPSLKNLSPEQASEQVFDYIDNISEKDFRKIKDRPSKQRTLALINAISRNISTEASLEALAKEAEIYDKNNRISTKTTRRYLDLLSQIFLLDELKSWAVHLRSNIKVRVKPKWHFVDPSIAIASMSLNRDKLIKDYQTLGFFFESLVIRDLRIYAEHINGSIYHYRDSYDLEIDAIVELPNQEWAAFEIKLGSETGIEEAKANFLKLKKRLSKSKLDKCKSFNVITSDGESYTDKDGVNIISIGHLFVN